MDLSFEYVCLTCMCEVGSYKYGVIFVLCGVVLM